MMNSQFLDFCLRKSEFNVIPSQARDLYGIFNNPKEILHCIQNDKLFSCGEFAL
ncbi:MAG: hypothetical protein KCHDKBKB_00415 [Elusimicrobia bacterium]|nr:hypothetical protein [Elusimicrobiota bacterium]